MKVRLSVKILVIVTLFFLAHVQVGNCELPSESDLAEIKLIVALASYCKGYDSNSCDEVKQISRKVVRDTVIIDQELSPEEISVIGDIIELANNCCEIGREMGRVDRQYEYIRHSSPRINSSILKNRYHYYYRHPCRCPY